MQILIVYRNNRNFKSACMWKTNQCKLSAILISRAVGFILLDLVDRQDNLSRLPGECRCFQCHRRALTGVRKVVQQLLFDRRVIIVHDFIILRLIIRNRKLQLVLNQLFGLLGQELRRDISGHSIPIALFFQLIDRRKMLFTISTNVHALAVCLNGCTERIVRVSFCFF